jgi:3-hydroxy acid dehydrogenase / malonic semialdehyde reductase
MNRIQGKLALVTGASSGIGEACARRLAAEGADVALWARRKDRLERLADELAREHGVTVHLADVDVRDRAAVKAAVDDLLDSAGPPHILVNNAGLAAGLDPIQTGDFDDWDRMIDTNVKGLLNVTRFLLPAMIDVDRGHVINIGSTAGHQVYPKGNVYNATKFAVTALTEAINLDVAGTKIRVSSVDPGFVETEFSVVRFHGDEERAEGVYDGFQPLRGDDVADAVAYVANLPAHVNVLRMVLLPSAQRNVYVLDRES